MEDVGPPEETPAEETIEEAAGMAVLAAETGGGVAGTGRGVSEAAGAVASVRANGSWT